MDAGRSPEGSLNPKAQTRNPKLYEFYNKPIPEKPGKFQGCLSGKATNYTVEPLSEGAVTSENPTKVGLSGYR